MNRLIMLVATGTLMALVGCSSGGSVESCATSLVGTVDGVKFAGGSIAELDYSGVLEIFVQPERIFEDADLPLDTVPMRFEGTARVNADGSVTGSENGFILSGEFDFDDCSGSGTFVFGFNGTGSWSLEPIQSGLF